jgi:hypothetical protein
MEPFKPVLAKVTIPSQPEHTREAWSWSTCRLLGPSLLTWEPYEAQHASDGSIRQSERITKFRMVRSRIVAVTNSPHRERITTVIPTGCCCWMLGEVSLRASGCETLTVLGDQPAEDRMVRCFCGNGIGQRTNQPDVISLRFRPGRIRKLAGSDPHRGAHVGAG